MKENMRRTAGPIVPAHSTGIKLKIEQHCWDKMFGWCRAANGEVSGLGLVKLDKGVFTVYDVFFPEQQGSTGYTKIGGEAIGRLYNYLHQSGRTEDAGNLKFWWHTHYNFNTFWSGTDDDQAQQLAHIANDWSLSLVINQKGDSLARTDIVSPVPVMIDQLPIEIIPNSKVPSKRNYKADIRKWVKPFYVPRKKVITWSPGSRFKVEEEKPKEERNINYAGHILKLSELQQVLRCPCGDGTCIDCKEILKDKTHV